MRTSILIFFTALLLSVAGCKSPPDPTLTINSYHYFVILPQGYEEQESWPLVFCLQGEGYDSQYIEDFVSYGLGLYLEENEDFPFVVVVPLSFEEWDVQLLDDVLDRVTAEYRIDLDRIYVTGFDWGGHATYSLAFEFPHRFAAIAPVAGWGDPEKAVMIQHLPVWIFHNDGDQVVPVGYAQEMYDALLACGGDVTLTVYDSDSHNAWDAAYSDATLYGWFLGHARVDQSP